MKKMLLLGVILGLIVAGCVGSKLEGKYYNLYLGPGNYLELHDDGSFYAESKAFGSITGEWKKSDNSIILSTTLGAAKYQIIEDGVLVGPNEDTLVKEEKFDDYTRKYEKIINEKGLGTYKRQGYLGADSLELKGDHSATKYYSTIKKGVMGTWRVEGGSLLIKWEQTRYEVRYKITESGDRIILESIALLGGPGEKYIKTSAKVEEQKSMGGENNMPQEFPKDSSSDVAKRWHKALLEGDKKEFFKLSSDNLKQQFIRVGFEKASQEARKAIKDIVIVREEIQGDKATVVYKQIFTTGGTSSELYMKLVKENGQWKVLQPS